MYKRQVLEYLDGKLEIHEGKEYQVGVLRFDLWKDVYKRQAQRHIMVLITVYHSTCRELVIVFFTVQRFLDTAIVLLAFPVSYTHLGGLYRF